MSFTLQTLTEGIRDRHVGQQNKRLVEKWSRTGLLRGMDDVNRENMATLLENQAAQLLREANTLGGDGGGSDIRGFTNIAFPIVRRVFGGLVANELVSIQPMSLPSGLLFYLDYTYGSSEGGDGTNSSVYTEGQSIYNNPKGKDIQEGSFGTGGQYDLVGSGFSRRLKQVQTGSPLAVAAANNAIMWIEGGAYSAAGVWTENTVISSTNVDQNLRLLDHDSQIIDRINAGETYQVAFFKLNDTAFDGVDLTQSRQLAIGRLGTSDPDNMDAISEQVQAGKNIFNVRRLNELGVWDTSTDVFTSDPFIDRSGATHVVKMVIRAGTVDLAGGNELGRCSMTMPLSDTFEASATGGDTLTVPSFESNFGGTGSPGDPSPEIPEIDIKIESIPVTAQTRKLRARWSPELAQDLNAYHSMDAEVELTQILSEQIALEIDREILSDLLTGAQGANFFWSRSPGKFVNKRTGAEIARTSTLNPGPAFTGTVREWYETLTETVIDVANEIHRKTLRGSANFIVVGPDVATILEASVLYRPSYSLDGDGQVGAPFTMGAEKVGTLSNRFTVYKDPYFPRNKVLVGYKGGSYLETGFVYAPYVPLIVTPTIFQPEDFTPRKGVMTRYGKKMVRADFFGTVTCLDMNVI